MQGLFWKVFAAGSAAFAVMFALSVRFNFATTIIGTILVLLLLTARPELKPPWPERGAYATAMGLCLLLAVGRLFEPLWFVTPFPLQRDILLTWMALSAGAWFLPGRGGAA